MLSTAADQYLRPVCESSFGARDDNVLIRQRGTRNNSDYVLREYISHLRKMKHMRLTPEHLVVAFVTQPKEHRSELNKSKVN